MKEVRFKILGLFMTVFAVSQFGHAEKAHATTPETNAQKNTPFDTIIHGGGCGCTSCMPPSDISAPDNPA